MAATRTDQQRDRGTAVARSVLYGFLARALAFPTGERLAELRETVGPLALTATTGVEGLDARVARAVANLARPDVELRRAHTLVFPPVESRDHPSYESAFASADVFVQTDLMADVAAFYRAHGLRVGGRERERPDHICAELEFMAFMAGKEAHALAELGPDEIAECRRTQASFLRDHLGCWGPAFGARLALDAADEPTRDTGRLLRDWLEADLAALGVEPARHLDRAQPQPPPDDGSCGLDAEGIGVAGALPPPSVTPVAFPRRRDTAP